MSEETSVVSEGKVVVFHYTLTDDDGEVIESSKTQDPLPYLHGAGRIVPGLEEAMEGRSEGDTFEVDVAPSKGYGEKEGPGPQKVDRGEFPDNVELYEGMAFTADAGGGEEIPLWITRLTDDDVFVDSNHPLAGQTLHFDVEILEVRDATDEEIAHGHAHGPTGAEGH